MPHLRTMFIQPSADQNAQDVNQSWATNPHLNKGTAFTQAELLHFSGNVSISTPNADYRMLLSFC